MKNLLPLQPGDLIETFADVDDLVRDVEFMPNTPIEVGVDRFVTWYRTLLQNLSTARNTLFNSQGAIEMSLGSMVLKIRQKYEHGLARPTIEIQFDLES
jgi:hypothetical protein